MARLFAEAGYDVAFTTAKGMLERVKATFDEGGTEAAVARYAKCDVLVLDDLGKEDATEWSVGTVFSVLDARYEDMRPTIVTSNYAPGALADRLARRGERVTAEAIASRISQTCRPSTWARGTGAGAASLCASRGGADGSTQLDPSRAALLSAAIEIAIHVLGGADAPARTPAPTRTVPPSRGRRPPSNKRKTEGPWTASRG